MGRRLFIPACGIRGMIFPKPEGHFSSSFILLSALAVLSPTIFNGTPTTQKSSSLTFTSTSCLPTQPSRRGWVALSRAQQSLWLLPSQQEEEGSSRRLLLLQVFQPTQNVPAWRHTWKCLDGKGSHCPWMGKADRFTLSWHQPKRALKAGMGWWANSTCCFYGFLEAQPDICSLFRCGPHQAMAEGTSLQGLPRHS